MRGATNVAEALPITVKRDITAIGRHIAASRKTRGLSQESMAARMFVSRQTLHRLEAGDPGIGLSVLASALFVLGQARRLRLLAESEPSEAPFENRSKTQRSRDVDLDF